MTSRGRSPRAARWAAVAATAALALLGSLVAPPIAGAEARPTAGAAALTAADGATNPLAGRRWGVYKGNGDQSWAPYVKATGTEKALLGKIALRPKAKWFGAWIPSSDIGRTVDAYIANATGGDPEVLVQMTVFRMTPWEHEACRRLPTAAEQASYKQWVDRFAAAVGDAHVALVLQPDGPFAQCVPGRSLVPSRLIAYSARKFSALPNTAVYIDGGASDWPEDDPAAAVDFLVPAGIAHTRGFALNSTHYTSVGSDIAYGAAMVEELARRGIPGKHFVVDTAKNGKPFTWKQRRSSNFDNSPVCRSRTDTRCVTLGIPPTVDVTNARWGLSATNRASAGRLVDGFLWFGRPWLYMQADPFVKSRALQLVRTSPWH
ncbi:glycoside hydrolase family 6 protein [Marmoricola sp. Leaf446]|uniref:glycoside hydrolase family 6 protein n=1 Tax=Marmoricola sp. Leaf446 TaxID=1736379 RepID=UPI0012E3E80B|nr:glycoside hydrolase family 6 protein [Marmoricola sp. Leaf446]